jgi:GR25 family glycosyltransferase involved in LPS biosynthesis
VNLREASGWFRSLAFRASRAILGFIPGGRISAFGRDEEKIGLILIVNLDRQPRRLRRTLRELRRFKMSDGGSLASLALRVSALDARDGRDVAATSDVEQSYRLADQLFVQPDAQLAQCFDVDEAIRMTRQEVAIARSHIEAWKTISTCPTDYALVLEDDAWFVPGAAATIERGWNAAIRRCRESRGPKLLYLSYSDAGGTAERTEECETLFRPKRGLWFLSGYVLSKDAASFLLRAMPVVGPVDLWMNYRFAELGALALATPAILQRPDGGSDNCNSILPYLARAGIVDSNPSAVPVRSASGPVLAWTVCGDREGLAMALSMLGLRVRTFVGDECAISGEVLSLHLESFDAIVDAQLTTAALSSVIANSAAKFIVEDRAPHAIDFAALPVARTAFLRCAEGRDELWRPLCSLLGLSVPMQSFPSGPPREWGVFRGRNSMPIRIGKGLGHEVSSMDDSAWNLVPGDSWPSPPSGDESRSINTCVLCASMEAVHQAFCERAETFPGSLATFDRDGLGYGTDGVTITCNREGAGSRPYRSGAFSSAQPFGHGRFEAEIKAARGSGLITGFFLYRDSPRQEIDVELLGNDPSRMLVNVYFNPGDDGVTLNFGYRGSPCWIELGFDSTQNFHHYAIDWRPERITWSVDGRVVHQRAGWDPTPIPHLPMRLHANLWVPRSEELAGRVDELFSSSSAKFRNVAVWS